MHQCRHIIFLALLVALAEGICYEYHHWLSGRNEFSTAQTPDKKHIMIIGGVDKTQAVTPYTNITFFNIHNKVLDVTKISIGSWHLSSYSVTQLYDEIYLIIPKITTEYYYIWNITNNSFAI